MPDNNTTRLAAQLIEEFDLEHPPIGIAFAAERPAGVPDFASTAPSTCSLWRHAESGVFYADAEDHANCLLGAMIMGFPLTEPQQKEIGNLVEQMCACDYIDPDEPSHLPSVGREKLGIVYGPLTALPIAPDVVLVWLTVRQAMLFEEASQAVRWRESGPSARVTGRPGCAVVPNALSSGTPALTFGCTGMRTNTEIGDGLTLGAIPGAGLDRFAAGLAATVQANRTMQRYYDDRKQQILTAGG